ncbi:YphA family membrane protein [Brevibacillus porteri]|uniref:YphA family membrane protein n=1 Tax=Brevibacillus porteri TaxID=2126350 RepID=UPI003D2094B9
MNEGTVAILIQWSLLCLVWMGSFDLQLQNMKMERRRVLAVISAFLICTFVNWEIYFAPIQVSLSGTILPLIASIVLYTKLMSKIRRLYLLSALATALLLFWLRWLFFTDPILLFWDERIIVPAVGVSTIFLMSRTNLGQLFQLTLAMPLADAIHSLYFWKLSGSCQWGSEYAQDLLWSGISLWALVCIVWSAIRRILGRTETESSHSDTGR